MNTRFLICIVALAALCTSCAQEERASLPHRDIPENAPDEEGWNSTIFFTDSSWTKAKLEVTHVRKYIAAMETLLDSGVYVEFYNNTGGLNATLSADSARIDNRTEDMCAFRNVHVYSERNRTTVDTEKLCRDRVKGRLHSDAWVRIVDSVERRVIEGKGFESDEALTEYVIFNVSGQSQQ